MDKRSCGIFRTRRPHSSTDKGVPRMRTFKNAAGAGAIMLAGMAPAISNAQMLENTSFTVGLKTWVTSWNTWFTTSTVNNLGNNASFAVIKDVFNRKADTELTIIPQLT